MSNTDFIGIDAEALGDGDDDTQLLDAWLVQRIAYNTERTSEGQHALCFSPVISSASDFTTFAGIRPYSAVVPHSVWKGWVVVNRHQTGVRFSFAYQSETADGAGTAAGYNRIIVTTDSGERVSYSLGVTYDSGTKTGYASFDLDFSEPVRQPYILGIVVEVEAVIATGTRVATTHGVTSNGETSLIEYVPPFNVLESTDGAIATEYWWENSAAPGPTISSFECMYYYDYDVPGLFYDIMNTTTEGGDGTRATMVQPVRSGQGATNNGRTKQSQSFFLRAMTIHPLFEQGGMRVSSLVADVLGPGKEVGANEHLKQAQFVHDLFQEWRPVLAGPAGRKNSASTKPQDVNLDHYNYASHWPTIAGDFDGTTAGQETTMIDSSFYLTTLNPKLELRAVFLAIQFGTNGGANGEMGNSRWDIDIDVSQIKDKASGGATWAADATSIASRADTPGIATHGSTVQITSQDIPPVLRGIDSVEVSGKAPATGASFWFKEGSLFPQYGDGDHLLTTISWEMQASGMVAADLARPYRLNMSAIYEGYDDPIDENGYSIATLPAQLRLLLIGFVLVEKPNV